MNTKSLVRDLYKHMHITPRYTAGWKVIETLLGIPRGQLDAIKADYSNKDKDCYRNGLKWAALPLGSCLLSLSHLQYAVFIIE